MKSLKTCFLVTLLLITFSKIEASPVGDVLNKSCIKCHGTGVRLSFNRFKFVDNLAKLRESAYIDLENPANSELFKEIDSGRMPKRRARLPQADIDLVLRWIEAGAPADGNVPGNEFMAVEESY